VQFHFREPLLNKGERMYKALVSEFVLDWRLSGKAPQTAISYSKFLFNLAEAE
jgi:hypothetical protein